MKDEVISQEPADPHGNNDQLDETCSIPPDTDLAETISRDSETDVVLRARSPDVRDTHFGEYELLSEIARGGMGAVFRAKHLKIDRIVALKVIKGSNPSAKELERFEAEANAAAMLDHPGIVPIYDAGVVDGEPYFTMKLVKGQSLSQKIGGKPIDPVIGAKLVRDISNAIAHAHEQGIIHRDLKPSNVLLDKDESPLVTDFGLAKLTDDDSDLTRTGQAIGTPSYMPPEQAAGERDRIDFRCDVYSLGAVLYSCLTGRPPFQGSTAVATVMQVINDDVAPPRMLNAEVPKDLDTICMKCLSKSPDRRYQTAVELSDDLSRYLKGEPINARPVSTLERAIKWVRRNPGQLLIAIASICALLGAGIAIQSSLSRLKLTDELEDTSLERSALQKSRQFIGRDDNLTVRPVGHDTDASLQLSIAELAIRQVMPGTALGAVESISQTDALGFEYHMMRRRLHRHKRSIELGLGATIQSVDFVDGELILNAHYTTGSTLFLNPESLELNNSTFIQRPQDNVDVDGPYWLSMDWQGMVEKAIVSPHEPAKEPTELFQVSPHRFLITDAQEQQVITIPKWWIRGKKLQVHDLETGELEQEFDPGIYVYDWTVDRKRRILYLGGARSKKWASYLVAYSLDDWSKSVHEAVLNGGLPEKIEVGGNGARLLVFDNEFKLGIFKTSDFSLERSLGKSNARILDMSFAPGDNRIAFGDERGGATVLDFGGEKVWHQFLYAHKGPCGSVAFGKNAETLYTAGRTDGSLKHWNVDEVRNHNRSIGMTGRIQDVAYSRDGKWMLFADDKPGERSVGAAILNRASGVIRDIRDEKETLGDQKSIDKTDHVVWTGFADSGATAVLVFRSGRIEWRNSDSLKLVGKMELQLGQIENKHFVSQSSSGSTLAVANPVGDVKLVDLLNRKSSAERKQVVDELHSINMGLDENTVFASGRRGETRQHLISIAMQSGTVRVNTKPDRRYFSTSASANRLKLFAFADDSGFLMLLDPIDQAKSWLVNLEGRRVLNLQFNQDDSRIIAAVEGIGAIILSVEHGSELLRIHDPGVKFVDLSPDDTELAIVHQKSIRRLDSRPMSPRPKGLDSGHIINVEDPSKNRPLNH